MIKDNNCYNYLALANGVLGVGENGLVSLCRPIYHKVYPWCIPWCVQLNALNNSRLARYSVCMTICS